MRSRTSASRGNLIAHSAACSGAGAATLKLATLVADSGVCDLWRLVRMIGFKLKSRWMFPSPRPAGHVGRFFRNHDDSRIGIAGDEGGHD
jgi:hypothetical protein